MRLKRETIIYTVYEINAEPIRISFNQHPFILFVTTGWMWVGNKIKKYCNLFCLICVLFDTPSPSAAPVHLRCQFWGLDTSSGNVQPTYGTCEGRQFSNESLLWEHSGFLSSLSPVKCLYWKKYWLVLKGLEVGDKVTDSQTIASGFGGVSRTDALLRGSQTEEQRSIKTAGKVWFVQGLKSLYVIRWNTFEQKGDFWVCPVKTGYWKYCSLSFSPDLIYYFPVVQDKERECL